MMPPSCGLDVFRNVKTANCKLYIPIGSIDDYSFASGWGDFVNIIEETVVNPSDNIVAPTISYQNGQLVFTSSTPDASYSYSIKSDDITTTLLDSDNGRVTLTKTYIITAYAKVDDKTSAASTATLVWFDANLDNDNPTSAKDVTIPATSFLLTQTNGMITLSGLEDEQTVTAYDSVGKQIATTKAIEKKALLNVTEMRGKVAVISINGKTVKILVK